jgi:hypothetical protein
VPCRRRWRATSGHRDARFRSGAVELWTKADSVTAFDDFEVRGLAP